MNYIRNFLGWYLYGPRQDQAEDIEEDDSSDPIKPDPLSAKPHRAWNRIKSQCIVRKLEPISPSTPISENSIRFVCVGDTHVRLEKKGDNISDIIPPGDVLLHVGDFTMNGNKDDIVMFNEKFGSLPHKMKILIAGNHDMTLDKFVSSQEEAEHCRACLDKFIYLEDAMLEFCGIKVYGAPWVPWCGNWGFTLKRGASMLRRWKKIPSNVDILMTHGPPLGYGDMTYWGYHVGCVDLLNTVKHRVKPKYHVYGHIHEGYGMRTDGQTVFTNAALCTKWYRPTNPPIVFDYPLPPGHSRRELEEILPVFTQFGVEAREDVSVDEGQVHKDAAQDEEQDEEQYVEQYGEQD